MIKRLVQLAALLAFPWLAQAQTATVTGHVLFPSGGAATNSNVCFSLQNFKPNLPRITSTGVIVQQQNWCIIPASDGSYSTPIDRNDLISPVGTFWRVDFLWNGIQQSSATYLINRSPFNLDTEIPLNQIPNAGPNQLITQSFVCPQIISSTTWVCTDNFNDPNVTVQTFNASGAVIYPDTVTVTTANTVTITFVVPQTGLAVVFHAGSIAIATNQPNVVLQNPLGSQTIVSQPFTLGSSVLFTTNGTSNHNGIENFNAALNANSGGSLAGTFLGSPTLTNNLTVNGAMTSNGGFTASAGITANDITDSFLTPGGCVQAGSGGHFTTVAACNTGSSGVSSVGLALPPEFTISNSPCTSNCTLTGTWNPFPNNYFLGGPYVNSIGGIFDGSIGAAGSGSVVSSAITPTTTHDLAFFVIESTGQSAPISTPSGWTSVFTNGNNGAVFDRTFSSSAPVSVSSNLSTGATWANMLFLIRIGAGSPTIIQSQSTTGAFTNAGNTFPSNTTSGNLLVAIVCGVPSVSPATATFKDQTTGNFFTQIGTVQNGSNEVCIAAMSGGITGGTTPLINVSLNGLNTNAYFLTMEISNALPATGEPVPRPILLADLPASVGGPPVGVFSSTTLGGNVSVPSSTTVTLMTRTVTMPASGCPCRAFASYSVYPTWSVGTPAMTFWVNDGTVSFATLQTGTSNAGSGGRTSGAYSAYSTGTYANGAVVTFTLFVNGGSGTATIEASPQNGSGTSSSFQIAISASN